MEQVWFSDFANTFNIHVFFGALQDAVVDIDCKISKNWFLAVLLTYNSKKLGKFGNFKVTQ